MVSCQLPQMSYFFSDKEKPVFFEPVEIFLPSYKFPLARSKNRTFETTFFLFDLKLFFFAKNELGVEFIVFLSYFAFSKREVYSTLSRNTKNFESTLRSNKKLF